MEGAQLQTKVFAKARMVCGTLAADIIDKLTLVRELHIHKRTTCGFIWCNMKDKNLDKYFNIHDIHSACNYGLFNTRINRRLFVDAHFEDVLIKYHEVIVGNVLRHDGSITNKYLLHLFFEAANFLQDSNLSKHELDQLLQLFKIYITFVLDVLKSKAIKKIGV
jgi:hypothetical protein